ncbi:tetratricopeptide repeat protein [Fibrella aquatica]|uniref:tetratricopeptide repeat protein n=1 Tax=Fibrella aquatica TaxID=3242487 RepID=UPI003520BEF5
MNPQKNINYGTITSDGAIHIGDIHYTIEERFIDSHSVLFLRIDKTEDGYEALLSAKNAITGSIANYDVPISVAIPTGLFEQVDEFQLTRRKIGGTTRYGATLPQHPEQSEAVLADALYNTFWTGEIRTVCERFITLLQQRKLAELLLVISTDDANLHQLPWEMILPRLSGSAGTLPPNNFGLVRSHLTTLDDFNQQGPTDQPAPLKLLFIPSLPENMAEGHKQLELEKEQRLIIQAVQGLDSSTQPKLVVDILDCASLAEIEKALTRRSHDIVHISGHGAFLTDQQQGVLFMEDEDGNEEIVTGSQLGTLLRRFASVKVLVLSACETAVGDATGSLARQMANVGIPAVVAMRFSVTDEAARQLAEVFYSRLATGDSFTKAVHDTRHALWQRTSEQRTQNPQAPIPAEWFTPVVFQNQGIGALLNPQRNYDDQVRKRFYPPLTFIRSQNTRLIGEDFIGRKRVLIELRQAFRQHKAVCIHGMGGLGKTTTAEAFAHNYRSQQGGHVPTLLFREGNYPIEEFSILQRLVANWKLKERPDEGLIAEIEFTLKNPNLSVLDKLQAIMTTCLQNLPTILLFDNAEDIHDENGIIKSAELHDFLRQLVKKIPRNCHVLFTTRYRLTDLQDCLMHLPISKMTYAEQYRYIQSSEQLNRLTRDQHNLLYQRFDGLPRAFEFLETVLIDQPDFNLDHLSHVEGQILENLLLSELFNSLNTTEQQLFTQASVLIGRVSIKALSYVLEKSEEELSLALISLQQKAIVFLYDKTFEIHPLTRRWVQIHHDIDHYLIKSLAHRAGIFYEREPEWNSAFAAKHYFEVAQAWNEYADLTLKIASSYSHSGMHQYAILFSEEIIAKNISSSFNLSAINHLSSIYVKIGKYDKALQFAQNSLEISNKIGNYKAKSDAFHLIGTILNLQGKYESAIKNHELSIEIAKYLRDKSSEGISLNNIGQVYMRLGRMEKAEKSFKESLSIATSLDDENAQSSALNSLGALSRVQRNLTEAVKYYTEGLLLVKKNLNVYGKAALLGNLGQVYEQMREFKMALEKFEESLLLSKEIGEIFGVASVLNNIGQLYNSQINYEKALAYSLESLSIKQKIGDKQGEGVTLNNIGQIYVKVKDFDLAFEYLQNSLKIRIEIGDIRGEGFTLSNIGDLLYMKSDYQKAIYQYQASLIKQEQISDSVGISSTLYKIGASYYNLNRIYKEAIENLMKSFYIASIYNVAVAYKAANLLETIISEIGKIKYEQILQDIATKR